jgi:hypothetical protein
MPTPAIVRVLSCSLVALALITSSCANNESSGKPSGEAKRSEPSSASSGAGAIAGKPVEGEGKPAIAAGDGGSGAKEYALEITPAPAKVGEPSKVSIKVVPQGPWHMNLEYPTKLEVVAPAGTSVAKPSLAKADAITLDEQSCEFAFTFTPEDAGTKQFTGEFKFAICQDEACVPKTETLAFDVTVE